ncbi:MAG: arginine--tRNA ligase [Candidatus Woesearchaeota archaeon]|nr:arginine--tRNA ligase [Candidatus Woesearchaeota archaeon]
MDFKELIAKSLSKHTGKEISSNLIEVPPDQKMGDYAFPCFSLAKELKKSPGEIAKELQPKLKEDFLSEIRILGPYLNFYVKKSMISSKVLKEIFEKGQDYGKGPRKKQLILVESPGPNTNKPLHLGHVRNMVLGNSIQAMLDFVGYDTKRIDMVNDRGVHICKSMLAYQRFGNDEQPKKKTDHFVGDYYVRYAVEEKVNPDIEKDTQAMLVKWENGDEETVALWKKMNTWAISGIQETYKRYGVKMDKPYFESDHYMKSKDVVQEGVRTGLFKKDEKGNIYYSDDEIEKKIVLRADGTSIYITQDIILGKLRFDDWHMHKMIYIVANEQSHHFKVLFRLFERLGYPFAKGCYHLAYGMVYLPEGKMKSREGTVVDADNLADDMKEAAREEIKKRFPGLDEKEVDRRAEAIGMSSIKFFILKFDALKDFVYNPKESLSFEGETGPYVQYSHARCASILKKYDDEVSEDIDFSLLVEEEEKALIKMLLDFQKTVEKGAEDYKPSMVTRHLLDLCQQFNEYYHKHKIIQEDKELEKARILLVYCVKQVIKTGLGLLGIEALDEM